MRRRIFPNLIGDIVSMEERQERLERVMQIFGITPEYPYTVNINDGTLNRVLLGKINGDYGIKIVDNAGNEVILANGTIVANAIKTGTLDCSLITVANLDAGSITTGFLSASKIQGGTLDCSLITVQNLNAGSITVGTFISINNRLTAQAIHGDKIQVGTLSADRITAYSITADKVATNAIESDKIAAGAIIASKINVSSLSAISADLGSITAGTITGATIRTAASGQRVVLDNSNQIKLYTPGSGAGAIYGDNTSIIFVTSSVGLVGNLVCTHLLLGAGGSEGDIENINWLNGENDLQLKVQGDSKILFDSSEGGAEDLSMYPKWGDFYATGTKNFRIKHPDHPNEGWIQYVSVESPEVALKIRGVSKLNSGEATITLPRHWVLVTEDVLTTLQLTPLGDCKGLFTPKSSITNESFSVKELQGGTSNAEFMWELTCTRKGYADFNPEQTVEEEIEKHAKGLIESPVENETKKEWLARRQAKANERTEFQEAVLTKYKKLTGKKYVDKTKQWQEKDKRKDDFDRVANKTWLKKEVN